MANLFRCGSGGSNGDVTKVPCCKDTGGTYYSYFNSGYGNTNGKTTGLTISSNSANKGKKVNDIAPEKLADCDWLVTITAYGKNTIGATAFNAYLDAKQTYINVQDLCMRFYNNYADKADDSKCIVLYFKEVYNMFSQLQVGRDASKVYYLKVDKEKSKLGTVTDGEVKNFCYGSGDGTSGYIGSVTVTASSYVNYELQFVPLINEKEYNPI